MSTSNHAQLRLSDTEFARQIQARDLDGVLWKELVVDGGQKAFLIEGHRQETVGPGVYTLQTFLQTMQRWTAKQSTAVLIRVEDQLLDVSLANILTAEFLSVEGKLTVAVRLSDPPTFLAKYLGQKEVLSKEEFNAFVERLVKSALRRSVGEHSIKDLAGPRGQELLDAGIAAKIQTSLRDYGLQFTIVHNAEILHERWSETQQLVGKAVLLGERRENEKKLQDIYDQEEMQQLDRFQRDQQIQTAKQELKANQWSADIDARIKRVETLRQLRATLAGEKVARTKDADQLNQLLHEISQQDLLRKHEIWEIEDSLRQQEDGVRRATEIVEEKHKQALQQLRTEFNLAEKLDVVKHDIAIAQLTDRETTRAHLESLEREEARFRKDLQWSIEKWNDTEKREHDRWQRLHNQRGQEAELDDKIATVRQKREAEAGLSALELEKQKQAAEREHQDALRRQQLDTLAALQAGNDASRKARLESQMDARSRATQMDIEKADAESRRKIAELDAESRHKLNVMAESRGLSVEQLLILEGKDPTALLMHEATEETKRVEAKEGGAVRREAEREKSQMYERMIDDHRRFAEDQRRAASDYADQRGADLKAALDANQAIAGQAFSAMQSSNASQTPPTDQPASPSPAEDNSAKVMIVCRHCGEKNEEDSRHCRRCGNKF